MFTSSYNILKISGFLELNFGFQSPQDSVFDKQEKFSGFTIHEVNL